MKTLSFFKNQEAYILRPSEFKTDMGEQTISKYKKSRISCQIAYNKGKNDKDFNAYEEEVELSLILENGFQIADNDVFMVGGEIYAQVEPSRSSVQVFVANTFFKPPVKVELKFHRGATLLDSQIENEDEDEDRT